MPLNVEQKRRALQMNEIQKTVHHQEIKMTTMMTAIMEENDEQKLNE